MKKGIVLLLLLMLCGAFLYADAPLEGAFIGGEVIAVGGGGYGIVAEFEPTDMPVSFYMGTGIDNLYVKGGVSWTMWEHWEKVPIGIYAGGGIGLNVISADYYGTDFLAGYEQYGIGECGLEMYFTDFARLRAGYTYFNGNHGATMGILLGYSKLGKGAITE